MNIKYKQELREELNDCLTETKDYLDQNSKDLMLLLDNVPKPGIQEFVDVGLLPDESLPMPYEDKEMLEVVANNVVAMYGLLDQMDIILRKISDGYEHDLG